MAFGKTKPDRKLMILYGGVFMMAGIVSFVMLNFMVGSHNSGGNVQANLTKQDKQIANQAKRVIENWQKQHLSGGEMGVMLRNFTTKADLLKYESNKKMPAGGMTGLFLAMEKYYQLSAKMAKEQTNYVSGKNTSECLKAVLENGEESCMQKLREESKNLMFNTVMKNRYHIYNTDLEQTTAEDMVKILGFYQAEREVEKKWVDEYRQALLGNGKEYKYLAGGFKKTGEVYEYVGKNMVQQINDGRILHDGAIIKTADGQVFLWALVTNGVEKQAVTELAGELEKILIK